VLSGNTIDLTSPQNETTIHGPEYWQAMEAEITEKIELFKMTDTYKAE